MEPHLFYNNCINIRICNHYGTPSVLQLSEYATIMEPHLFYNNCINIRICNPAKTQQFSLIISCFSHVSCVQVKNFLK
jgi:hypothetical protein